MILTKLNIASVNLERKVNQLIESELLNQVLFIVPTNRKLRSFKKKLIDQSPHRVVNKLNIETLTTISEKLLSEVERFIPLSEAASTILIKQSAESVKLNYLVNYKDEIPFGTLERIKNVISEYKRHGIYPDRLREEAEKLELSEKIKALDIASIYELYLQKCRQLNALEIGDIYYRINDFEIEKFNDSFRSIYPDVKLIVIDGFDELSVPEVDIIDKLADRSGIELYLNFDYYKRNPLVFSHLDKCYNLLRKKNFVIIEDKSLGGFNKFEDFVRKSLFLSPAIVPANKNDEYENFITKISARSVEEEIELIAKQIKNLILINDVEPHNICVAFNLINKYSSLVRDIFKAYGIPVNLTDRIALDNSPPVTALINFFEIAENDFYYKNIFRALNTKYFEKFEVDTSNLNKVAAELKIVSGFNNWIDSVNEKIKNYELDEEEYQSLNPEDYRKALNDLTSLNSKLQPFTKKQTIKEFYFILQKFITDSGLGISVLNDGDNSEQNIKGLTTFLEVTEEIFNLLQLEYGSDKKFGLNFYLDQLKTASNWARFNIKERSDLGVTVTSVNEIRGLDFDYLFIGGLNDGVFPTRFNPEIFFSGSFAKQDYIHQVEERYRFYQALCAWKKHLYLSCSFLEEGKDLVESTFLKDFVSLFSIPEKDYTAYRNTAYNYEDVLIKLGSSSTIDPKIKILAGENRLNEISKKIDVENTRINNPFYHSPFNGFIGINEDNAELLKNMANREFSISQLETYAKCPFKYFATYVLNLSTVEEPTEELEAIEIGSILHRILYLFYTKLKERGIVLKNCNAEEFKIAEKLIFEIAEENLSSPIFNSALTFYEKERILGIGGNRRQSILYKFLETEHSDKSEFIPNHFEVNFGSVKGKERDQFLSVSEPVEYENIKLRGKIDRIDTAGDKFDVVDYKLSGKKPTIGEISEGISLQLPVYFYAAEKLFEANSVNSYPNEMYIYSLKYNRVDFGKNSVSLTRKKKYDAGKLAEETIDISMKKIKSYVKAMSKGNFPLTSLKDREKNVCGYCNFKEICRVEETEL